MRILWFTLTKSLYAPGRQAHRGGGWQESLESLLREREDIELAVSFFHPKDSGKKIENGNTYYPILKSKKSRLGELQNFLFSKTENANEYLEQFLEVINDFKPDIIHIFGTESEFARIIAHTEVPVVIHLQGILGPLVNAYYPPGFNKYSFLFNSSYKLYQYKSNPSMARNSFKDRAVREVDFFKKVRYFMGRTHWDKQICKFLAPDARYFKVDEVLRGPFYSKTIGEYRLDQKISIVSTISPNTYKGIDVILKTAQLLTEHDKLDFEWKVIGIDRNNKLLKFFINSLNINPDQCNIKCLGVKDVDELAEELINAHLYVHASYIDNSPNSVCEAQMVGLPVIACNVGGVSTLIEDGITGLLVPSNGVYEIAYQVLALNENPLMFQQMAQRAREIAMKRHDRKSIIDTLFQTYSSIIAH